MLIKVTFYNGNLGFFMVINFILEFSPGGLVMPRVEMSMVKQEMFRTDNDQDLISTILDFTSMATVAYYAYVQVHPTSYFLHPTS